MREGTAQLHGAAALSVLIPICTSCQLCLRWEVNTAAVASEWPEDLGQMEVAGQPDPAPGHGGGVRKNIDRRQGRKQRGMERKGV